MQLQRSITASRCRTRATNRRATGFTLIELLTAMGIFVLLLVVLFSTLDQATGVLRRSTSKIESFQSARLAFDLLVRNVNQATLNAYHDYAYDNGTNAPPTRYLRRSELSFVIGPAGGDIPEPETGQITLPGTLDTGQAIFFQGFLDYVQNTGAYGGMESLLNACGYFVDFGTLPSVPSHVSGSSNPYRYRLMQMLVPAEKLENYENPAKAWFVTNEAKGHILPVADNVIALIVRPLDPGASPADLGEHFTYDSRIDVAANPQPVTANQLPPVLQITMVSIDESSAKRIDNGATPPEAIAEALKERFRDVELFESDLEAVQDQLIANGISCQVFSSAVPLRESKWTK